MEERILISKKSTGLGSDMATFVGACSYSKQTSRTLVVDWRDSLYLPDRSINAFPRLFRKIDQVEGVKVICDDSVAERSYPSPVIALKSWDYGKYLALLEAGDDLEAPTLLSTRTFHVLPSTSLQRKFFRALQLHDDVQERIRTFKRKEFAGSTVIGVHLRHGNGERLGGRRNPSLDECCERIARSCQEISIRIGKQIGKDCRIFVCTDSPQAEECLKSRLPGVVTFDKHFRKAGAGQMHIRSLGLSNAKDAQVEMFLLASCASLVYSNSWFSYYARVMGTFEVAPISITPRCAYAEHSEQEPIESPQT
jgi:Nodulation protein Z (NodZ)